VLFIVYDHVNRREDRSLTFDLVPGKTHTIKGGVRESSHSDQ